MLSDASDSKTKIRSGPVWLAGMFNSTRGWLSELLFAVGASAISRDPASPLAYRNGGLADSLAMVGYLFLAFGVLRFPLDAPRVHSDDATLVAGS